MSAATLAEALAAAATDTPDRVLIVDGAEHLDCATLYRRATELAQVLLERMPVGSVVSFMLPNWHEAAVIYLGATLAGMVVNPILPSLREHELTYILADCNSRMIFIPSTFRGHDYRGMLTTVCAQLADPPEVVPVRGQQPWPTARSHTALPTLDPDDVRMILYTSGTTGAPKGVLHSHRSLGALINQLHRHWSIEPGADGYFRTGDLGRWTDDGYLVVTGRAKDLIIRNGENISPKEIEDVLAGHPDITEVAIVGLPDARTGERAVAVLVGADTVDVAALQRFLTERGVAKFKMPEQVQIWDALPKNDAGKVLKHRIRTELAACQ